MRPQSKISPSISRNFDAEVQEASGFFQKAECGI